MKVVVDIPESMVEDLRQAVDAGGYRSTTEFVEMALQNQIDLEIEGQEGTEQLTTIEELVDDCPQSETAEPPRYSVGNSKSQGFSLSRQGYEGTSTFPEPTDAVVNSGVLWGQFNRLLPVKFVLRLLTNRVNEEGSPVLLSPFRQRASELAREFGQQLEDADDEMGHGRGEKLSSGFPVGSKKDRSLERFQHHFVGEVNSNGTLRGAPLQLRFANVSSDSRQKVAPTDAGKEFAKLPNPILDSDSWNDHTLSEEERTFYFEHLQIARPAELRGMAYVVDHIASGTNRPTPLNDAISRLNEDWSKNQASTIRTGLISRMYELGLIKRERVGQRGVRYSLTPSASILDSYTNDTDSITSDH